MIVSQLIEYLTEKKYRQEYRYTDKECDNIFFSYIEYAWNKWCSIFDETTQKQYKWRKRIESSKKVYIPDVFFCFSCPKRDEDDADSKREYATEDDAYDRKIFGCDFFIDSIDIASEYST